MPTKARPKRRPSAKPRDMRTVTAYLSVRGGVQALDWYKKAFGAEVQQQELTPDGKVVHARMKLGDTLVMLSDDFGPPVQGALPESRVTLHVYIDDVDRAGKRVVAAGATVRQPLADQFWGERYGSVTDPFGHNWSISMRIPMSKREMEAKRLEAMQGFAQG